MYKNKNKCLMKALSSNKICKNDSYDYDYGNIFNYQC